MKTIVVALMLALLGGACGHNQKVQTMMDTVSPLTVVRVTALENRPDGCVAIDLLPLGEGASAVPSRETLCGAEDVAYLRELRLPRVVSIEHDRASSERILPAVVGLDVSLDAVDTDGIRRIWAMPRPSPLRLRETKGPLAETIARAVAANQSIVFAATAEGIVTDAVAVTRDDALAMLGMRPG